MVCIAPDGEVQEFPGQAEAGASEVFVQRLPGILAKKEGGDFLIVQQALEHGRVFQCLGIGKHELVPMDESAEERFKAGDGDRRLGQQETLLAVGTERAGVKACGFKQGPVTEDSAAGFQGFGGVEDLKGFRARCPRPDVSRRLCPGNGWPIRCHTRAWRSGSPRAAIR